MAGKGIILSLLICCHIHTFAQLPAATEEQLENRAAQREEDTEDDMQEQQREITVKHKISLNAADAGMLRSLGILSSLQISNFLSYRQQMGKLLSIYELQAVPGFDEETIRKLLPHVQTGNDLTPHYSWYDYLHKGAHTLLLRYGRQPEKSTEYMTTDSTPAHYLGSPDRYMLRYRYQLPGYISWGAVAEKDAGEKGMDFLSAHLFIRNYKCIKAFAMGDFTVNMGQGLLNWQSLAFGKGPAVMQVKREGELLRPYASSGEFLFYRGTGITLQKGNWQGTAFISWRQLDGNITNSSGYHRSAAEIEKRHSLTQLTTGGNITYEKPLWHISFNMIRQQYSTPVGGRAAPYNMFAFAGKQLAAVSMDYSFTWRNLHCFGESAVSDNGQPGLLHGILAGVCRNADLVILYRYYSRGYQSVYADAWGEYYKPANESGLYTGVSIKLSRQLKLDTYSDVFRFPWVQYRLPSPGGGREVLAALTYTPDKQTEVFIRYISSQKQQQAAGEQYFIKPGITVKKQSWRCQVKLQATKSIALKSRVEVTPQGSVLFQEVLYTPVKPAVQCHIRYTGYVTGGTENGLYTITRGVLYEYAVSRLSGSGRQYQAAMRWKVRHGLTVWIRYQLTENEDVSKKSLVICQLQYLFQGSYRELRMLNFR